MESFRFAWNALKVNLLRTFLSLLGVTIGIFAIITVFTIVDSLEKNIKDSFSFLGAGVIYIEKWPFPGGGGEYKWWEYFRRPNVSYTEFKFLENNLKAASSIAIFAIRGNVTAKYKSNSINNGNLRGGSYMYNEIFELNIEDGRYFTYSEMDAGRNVVIIGNEIKNTLFPTGQDPIGKEIKINNRKYTVIGTIKREGESFLGTPSNDDNLLIPYNSFRKMFQTGTGSWNETTSRIGVKGMKGDEGLVELENETIGMLRSRRGLKPKEGENFALNRPEAIANIIGGVFVIINLAGAVIGGFAILVGGFGIANIMFVSVQERISIIGLQKSLGAKNYFILFQFLFESIFLSVIGGLAGLFFVYLITYIPMGDLEVVMSMRNILLGLGISAAIGIISGIIPAIRASRLNPVIALRS
jgi:putative ABC transport system permease protein